MPRTPTPPLGILIEHSTVKCCPGCRARLEFQREDSIEMWNDVEDALGLVGRVAALETWKEEQKLKRAKSEGRDEVLSNPEKYALGKKVAVGAGLVAGGVSLSQLVQWLVQWLQGG